MSIYVTNFFELKSLLAPKILSCEPAFKST